MQSVLVSQSMDKSKYLDSLLKRCPNVLKGSLALDNLSVA